MSDDETYERADAGASNTFPAQAGSLAKGDFVVINGKPCRIVDISTSKTGKHGHAKANITGIDVFTGKKYEDVCPTSHNMSCPNVSRTEYSLLDISGDSLSLMADDGSTREDLNLPEDEELAKGLKEAFEAGRSLAIIVLKAMDQEAVIQFKDSGSDK
jgi:translation initiation factor 5A